MARRSVISRHVRKVLVLGFLLAGACFVVWAAVGYFFDPRAALFSQNNLDRTLYLARAAVMEETGRPFRMPLIRAKHRIEVNEYFIEEMTPHLDVSTDDPRRSEREQRLRDSAYLHSLRMHGLYLSEKHEIWIVRSNLDRDDSFWRNPDLSLWMLILHEAAHAADHDHFGSDLLYGPDRDEEETRIWRYLIEGHADYIMLEVLKRDRSAHRVEELYLTERSLSGSAYTQGSHFWNVVLAGKKTTADKVFRHPPQRMSELFDPNQYLKRIRSERSDVTSSNSAPTSGSPDLPR